MKRLLFLLLALSAGCAEIPMLKDFEVNQSHVRLILIDKDRISAFCETIMDRPGDHLDGCARWSADRTSCEIYVTAPESVNDLARMATIGHEVWHCFRGRFHP